MFKSDFFGKTPEGLAAYQEMVTTVLDALTSALPDHAYSGESASELRAKLNQALCPPEGKSFDEVLQGLQQIIGSSIAVWNPHTAAHLHCPVLIPSLAAEMVISALNQSMDSFDQAPSATVVEGLVLDWLCRLADLPPTAGGTFTAGGTQSNYMGLLLARDHYSSTRWNWSVMHQGLPPQASRLRILCSEAAHFSVEKSAYQLGLGTDAVVKVVTDHHYRLDVQDLKNKLEQLRRDALEPMAIVVTAGTTDFGSIDPVAAIAPIAKENGAWLHVDAAYGGALLLSDKHRAKLAGLSQVNSMSIDFHKAFFQPISCAAFLTADTASFDLMRLHVPYLNPESHEYEGMPDLVTRSVLTTRRFDALKLWVSLQTIGRKKYGQMVDRIVELAEDVAGQIKKLPHLELLSDPEFGCVIFRYCPTTADVDVINEALPLRLFNAGIAVIGHTHVQNHAYLKLTLSNPAIEPADLTEILRLIGECGQALDMQQI